LRRINWNAAGIDVGSQEHYVAVPEDRDEQAVRRFGCFTPDLHEMAKWLISCGIETVAMESTGVYWVPIFQVLEQYGLDVRLVDASHVKNVPGRKTDVLDCQWLQELHTFGLLRGAFIPPRDISILRGYWRHRDNLVKSCSSEIQHIQKSLEQMNIQLHKVLSDISGLTGMRIIKSIVEGERRPEVLARMKDFRVKSSEETIAKALTGNYREDHLFTLKQAVELYEQYQEKIAGCDRRLEQYLSTFESKGDPKKKIKRKNRSGNKKNIPAFDLRTELYRVTGADLTQIYGIDAVSAQTIISECGFDMSRFKNEKHFASYLGLCPNNRITGGKIKRTRSRKVANRAATTLRVCAQTLHSSKTALGAYYRRMRGRLGAPKAITATARKLALQVYRILKYGGDYVDRGQQYYEEQYQKRVLRNLTTRAKQMGYTLVPQSAPGAVS
jgi:transposase